MNRHVTPDPPESGEFVPRHEHGVGRSVVAFRGVFWTALSMWMPSAVNFLVFMVTSRILGPEDFGVVALGASIAMFAIALGPFGFGEALVQRADLRTEHLDSVFWLCMGYGVVAAAVMYACGGLVGGWFDAGALALLVPVFSLKVLFELANVVPHSLIVRSVRFHLVALRTLMATLVSATIAVTLVLAGYGLWALVFAQLADSLVKAVTSFWTSGWRPRGGPSVRAIRELGHYGLFASGNQFVQFLGSRADQLLVGLFLGVRPVGFYNFSKRIYSMINDVVSGALGTVSHPMFSAVQDQPAVIRRGFLISTFMSSVISFPVFAGMALVADMSVPVLFGEKWIYAVGPLRLLCLLGMISCIGTLQSSLIKSRGKANWWFYYQLASSLLNLSLVALLARYGITIMLAGMVLKTYLIWPVAVTMTLRLIDMRLADYLRQFVAPLGAVVVMAGAVMLARQALGDIQPALALAAVIAVGAAAYAAALFAFAPKRILELGGTVLKAARAR